MLLAGGWATARRNRTRLTAHCWPFRRFGARREEVEKSTTPAGLRHISLHHGIGQASALGEISLSWSYLAAGERRELTRLLVV